MPLMKVEALQMQAMSRLAHVPILLPDIHVVTQSSAQLGRPVLAAPNASPAEAATRLVLVNFMM